jgi:predicted enzyme related to lactoylglutathione lyase
MRLAPRRRTSSTIQGNAMKRVTGIGGIFFKAKDPKALGAWYRDHLGLEVSEWGGAVFQWGGEGSEAGMTIWSPFAQDSDKMKPSPASFMLNFRVADLDALLAALRAEGCEVIDNDEPSEYGKFAWVMDPEGNKVELWEPPAGE